MLLIKFSYIFSILVFCVACGSNTSEIQNTPVQQRIDPSGKSHRLEGLASYYATSLDGNKTASGEVFDSNKYTAAHRTLPFGTIVRVVDPNTKNSVVVKINDRGPFGSKKRIIDLSRAAAKELNMIRKGVMPVRIIVERWPH